MVVLGVTRSTSRLWVPTYHSTLLLFGLFQSLIVYLYWMFEGLEPFNRIEPLHMSPLLKILVLSSILDERLEKVPKDLIPEYFPIRKLPGRT